MPTATERMSANQNCPRKFCQIIVSQPSSNYYFYLWHILLIFPVFFFCLLIFGKSYYVLHFVLFFCHSYPGYKPDSCLFMNLKPSWFESWTCSTFCSCFIFTGLFLFPSSTPKQVYDQLQNSHGKTWGLYYFFIKNKSSFWSSLDSFWYI